MVQILNNDFSSQFDKQRMYILMIIYTYIFIIVSYNVNVYGEKAEQATIKNNVNLKVK